MPETSNGANTASQLLPSTRLLKVGVCHEVAKDSSGVAAVQQKVCCDSVLGRWSTFCEKYKEDSGLWRILFGVYYDGNKNRLG